MGILKVRKKELNGQSEEFKGSSFEGENFKLEVTQLPFSSVLEISKNNTKIDEVESANTKNMYIEQLTACVKYHEGIFSENGELTKEQAIELFEYHQEFANIVILAITDVSFKKK